MRHRHDGRWPWRSVLDGAWLAPFGIFTTLFLILPALGLAAGSFVGVHGGLTLGHVRELFQEQYLSAYRTTVALSAVTAAGGGIVGLALAWAAVNGGLPRPLYSFLLTFSGVASNFAGIPLAFAFAATLGPTGLVTAWFGTAHIDLYGRGFSLFTFTGLAITYLYFQIPLMVLIIMPSVEHVTRWSEAAAGLGASSWQYWWRVAFPVLRSPLLGATLLLFGNSFGAYATAYALTSGMINLVPILIGQVMSGNVFFDPGLGDALALGMVVVMGATFAGYTWIRRRAVGWVA